MTRSYELPPDPIRDAGFPTVSQLRRGIVLNYIAHAFWPTTHPIMGQMVWERDTFFEDDMQGEHWAVSFPEGGAVAVFYSSESSRNPFPEGSPPYDQARYFQGMPRHLEPARDRALAQMFDLDFGVGNAAGAAITAAMWAHGERFTANEPWADVYDHSLWVLHTYLLPPEDALREWWTGTGFSDALRWAPWSLFERRVASTVPTIPIEAHEWDALVEVAGGPARASRAEFMLADVGISLEPYVSSPETERGPVSDSTT